MEDELDWQKTQHHLHEIILMEYHIIQQLYK